MKKILVSIISVLALSLAGCGGDKGAEEQAEAGPSTAMEAAPAAAEEAVEMGATIDHSRDEKEFMLRRTIGGLERMIEQYKADGYDSVELESSLKAASADLAALIGS